MTRSSGAGAHRVRTSTLLLLLLGSLWTCLRLAVRTADATRHLLRAHQTSGLHAGDLADVVTVAMLAVGAATALWYAVTALAGLAVRRLPPTAGVRLRAERMMRRWGAPVLRRALSTTAVAGLGVALTVTSSGAVEREDVPADLGWGAPAAAELVPAPPPTPTMSPPSPPAVTVPTAEPPTRAATTPRGPVTTVTGAGPTSGPTTTTTAASPPGTTAPQPTTGPPTAPGHLRPASVPAAPGLATAHEVRPGESLWSIAATHLPAGTTAAEIAAEWPRWYETNRVLLGADPDLIHPGQLLRAPIEEES